MGVGTGAAALRWPSENISEAPPRAQAGAVASEGGYILLNSNENPYGPSPRVANAIRAATSLVNRYAFMKYDEVAEQIASHHRVKPEQVLFACGSTEIFRVAACAFLGNTKKLIQAVPTFEALAYYSVSVGSEVTRVPITRRYAHDLEAMLSHADGATGLVYICNPNNPTGSLTPRQDIESFISKLPATTQVLIDEAYHDYVVPTRFYSSFIDSPLDDERVIVTRTFSKIYGLAGLRLGYAVASPKIIEKIRKFVTLNSLNVIMSEVVGVAFGDKAGLRAAVERNRDDLQEFLNRAVTRNLSPIDPHTNFVMMNIQHSAAEVIEHFRRHKILIGHLFPSMDTYIRVSLGTPDEMKAFWQTWNLLPWSNKKMHH
ncbi:MAG: pyridoxal phosphate-dependent aminotransferase [Terriglobales bacterium]